MSRWVRFIIAILVGIALGLFYGWVINPVEYRNTTPEGLRQDYQTDYVLMVAEAHQAERDAQAAIQRLGYLGNRPATEIIQKAIDFASEHDDYPQNDLALLKSFLEQINEWQGISGATTP